MTRTRAIAYFLDSLNADRCANAPRVDRGDRTNSPKPLAAAERPGKARG